MKRKSLFNHSPKQVDDFAFPTVRTYFEKLSSVGGLHREQFPVFLKEIGWTGSPQKFVGWEDRIFRRLDYDDDGFISLHDIEKAANYWRAWEAVYKPGEKSMSQDEFSKLISKFPEFTIEKRNMYFNQLKFFNMEKLQPQTKVIYFLSKDVASD